MFSGSALKNLSSLKQRGLALIISGTLWIKFAKNIDRYSFSCKIKTSIKKFIFLYKLKFFKRADNSSMWKIKISVDLKLTILPRSISKTIAFGNLGQMLEWLNLLHVKLRKCMYETRKFCLKNSKGLFGLKSRIAPEKNYLVKR